MIYLILSGRVGNQLFMFAAAEEVRKQFGGNDEIVVNDRDVLKNEWINSLKEYPLDNTRFTDEDYTKYAYGISRQHILFRYYLDFVLPKDYSKKFEIEKKCCGKFNHNGLILCQNGYLPYKDLKKKDDAVLMMGYFQSDRYFANIGETVKSEFDITANISKYVPGDFMEKFKTREVVCISAKVQHNVANPMYNVCTKEYWEKAIAYILDKVKNPLFFICSDNVEYVMNNLIDTSKYDVIEQPKDMPVHIALALMSLSKHFIIGNTTYAWWAQYLCKNQDKIVVAPSRWMNCDMPIDIYQDGWKLIDV